MIRPADVIAVAGLLVIGVVLPFVIGTVSGSILVPHNDDPSMRRAALSLYETGTLQLNGWTSMTLVGQLLLVQPFLWATGGGPWGFVAPTSLLALAGIPAAYALVRRMLSVPRSVMTVLAVLLFPGFLLNTTSFMTDVPTWAVSMACLAVGAAAVERTGPWRWRLLVASMVLGGLAFSIREFGLAAPVAVLAVAAASDRRAIGRYIVMGLAVAAACAVIYAAANSLPGQHVAPAVVVTGRAIRGIGLAFATLALLLSPAIVLAIPAWWRRWRLLDLLVGLLCGLAVYGPALLEAARGGYWPRMLVGNLLEPGGALGTSALAGGRPLLFIAPWWDLLNAGALIFSVALCVVLGGGIGAAVRHAVHDVRAGAGHRVLDRLASVPALLLLFGALYGVVMGTWGVVVIMFDRYLWLLILPMYALLLARPAALAGGGSERRRPWPALRGAFAPGVAVLLLAGFAAASILVLVNGDAYDAARWRIGERAVALGFDPGTIDAGLEWVEFHATGLAAPNAWGPPYETRYEAWWPSFRLCAMASASPLDRAGFTLVEAEPAAYRLLLFAGPQEPLYLYRVTGYGCP